MQEQKFLPMATSLCCDDIAQFLKLLPRWLCWQLQPDDPKPPKKVPMTPKNGKLVNAAANKPENWLTFDEAISWYNRELCSGVGFALCNETPHVCCIDVDHCVDGDGNLTAEAKTVMELAQNSYTELSQSGTGIHVWVIDNEFHGVGRKGSVEVYGQDRYITVTGVRVQSSSAELLTVNGACRNIIAKFFGEPAENLFDEKSARANNHVDRHDDENSRQHSIEPSAQLPAADRRLVEYFQSEKCRQRDLNMFALFTGDKATYIEHSNCFDDDSQLDMNLMLKILFYVGGDGTDSEIADRALRIFGASALAKRDKWQREDYRLRTLSAAFNRWSQNGRKTAQRDAVIDSLFSGNFSDLDYARRFETFFGDRVRWMVDEKNWLLYKTNEFDGGLWQRRGEQNSCLLPHVRELTDEMTLRAKTDDERKLANVLKSTRKSLSAVTMMKSLSSILVTSDDLDTHGELLNVRNGVIDLTNGKLLQASPELLLTQQAAAVYNPKCTDTTFADFIRSVMPDTDTREAVTRFLGYVLTADVSAEKFLLIYGRGGNGKGVLLLTLRTLLKDYAVELPVDTVLENRGRLTADANGRATTEISPLASRRLGIIDELPRNRRLDVAKVNRLTGGDQIPFRKLYGEFSEIAPTHKLIMTGNYRPQIDDPRDKGLLRRLIAVKFEQDFTENPDETLKKRLLTDSSLTGALNVLVPAAVEFCRAGLLPPSAKMKIARDEYLAENDFVADYLSEHCEFGDRFYVTRTQLLKHMREHCTDTKRYRDADLADMIAKVDGVTCRKYRNLWTFYGIQLAPPKQGDSDRFIGEPILSSELENPPF